MSVIGFIDLPQIFGFATGLDNMAVIAGLGLAALAKDKRIWILSSFIIFELFMPVIGFWLGAILSPGLEIWGETLGLGFLGVAGLLIIGTSLFPKIFANFLKFPAAIVALAFLLSFDNLFAGAGLGVSSNQIGAALIMGVIAASLCVVGFVLGSGLGAKLRQWGVKKTGLISGAYLSGLALFLAVSGG